MSLVQHVHVSCEVNSHQEGEKGGEGERLGEGTHAWLCVCVYVCFLSHFLCLGNPQRHIGLQQRTAALRFRFCCCCFSASALRLSLAVGLGVCACGSYTSLLFFWGGGEGEFEAADALLLPSLPFCDRGGSLGVNSQRLHGGASIHHHQHHHHPSSSCRNREGGGAVEEENSDSARMKTPKERDE
jgi:hypothetical protein